MAKLDITKAFDRSFLERLILKDVIYNVDENGILKQDTISRTLFYGVVTPIDTNTKQNGFVSDTIEIYTMADVTNATADKFATLIEYNDFVYRVINVQSFKNYGKGYYKVIAQNESLNNARIDKLQ